MPGDSVPPAESFGSESAAVPANMQETDAVSANMIPLQIACLLLISL